MVARTRALPHGRFQVMLCRHWVLGSLAFLLLVSGGGCAEGSAEPTATPHFAAELDGRSSHPYMLRTFEAMPDYRQALSLRQAAVLLKWEPLAPAPDNYQLATGRVDVVSYLGEGEVLVARYSTPTGVDFELRQAHHEIRSIPVRPEHYIQQEVGGFLLNEWADEYQSFAEITRTSDAQWRGFVVVYTPNLLELTEFVRSLR